MTSSHILIELVIVLGTAAFVTLLFQALRLPVVLGYVLAGLLIGPHVPVPLVADADLVHVLSELGVILLMFTIGLELPLHTLARVGVSGALAAVFEVGLVVAGGTLVARLLGFDPVTAVFAGACLGISSTMLVATSFEELGWKGGFTDVVFTLLVFEDLIAIVLLAVIAAIASGTGLDAAGLASLIAKLAGFLALMLAVGVLIVPRVIRWIAAHARRETLAITALLVCFGGAAVAASAGYSVALGAFLGGVVIAESGKGQDVRAIVEPFRDVFATVFFVSVGMTIEPAMLLEQAPRIAAFTAVVLVLKPIGVTIGVFLSGHGLRPAVRSGLSLAQIGEFSFVIAAVLGNAELFAVAVGVSCATMLTSPLLIRNSEQIAAWTARRMPQRLATFVSFYESWIGARSVREASSWRRHGRSVVILAVDAGLVVAIIIAGATLGRPALADAGLTDTAGAAALIAGVTLASAPFLVIMILRVGVLARRLAGELLPSRGPDDLGRAGRRALTGTFQLGIAAAILVPIVATVQVFVPGSFVLLLAVALVVLLGLGIVLRRSIADFEGHVRAGSELILEMLSQPQAVAPLAQVAAILPGFEGTATCTIPAGGAAVGRSLAQLDLRARTGATVLTIVRGTHGMATPSPTEPLLAGDVVALAGSDEAIAAARELLASDGERAGATVD